MPPARRARHSRNALLVLVCALAAYANSLPNGFVYDDIMAIRDNPRIESPWNLGAFFGTSYWDDETSKLYRPLTILSFAIDRAVFGPGPFGVHLTNVLANAGLAVLVYALLSGLLAKPGAALLASLLFTLHPVHTEVVANGVGRSDLLSTALALGALLLHLRYARAGKDRIRPDSSRSSARRSGIPLAGALALYFGSLLFKESTLPVPALAFLAEWLLLEGGRIGPVLRRWRRFALYALPFGAYLVVRLSVIGAGMPAVQEVMAHASPHERFFHASETLLRYLGQLAFPLRLCGEYSDYSHPVRSSAADPAVLASLLLWPAVAAGVLRLHRSGHLPHVFAVAWFGVTILPVSNLFFAIGTVRADRLLFLPSLGFVLLLALLLAGAPPRFRAPAWILAAGLLGFYAWRTSTRNLDWRSSATFWPVTVRQNAGSPIAWAFLGDVAMARGDFREAERCFGRAIELRDGAGFFYPEAHTKHAQILLRRGERAGAEEEYRLVVLERPRHYAALVNLIAAKLASVPREHGRATSRGVSSGRICGVA